MDSKTSNPNASRLRTPQEKPLKKSDFSRLVESAGFLVLLGLLFTGAGLILFRGFYNRFSMYVFDAGFTLALFGAGVKVLDIFLKIIGRRL